MKPIDITITATWRPELLERTLESFKENLFGSQMKSICRAVINVDPTGSPIDKTHLVCDIVNRFFDQAVMRTPNTPSFPDAFKWVWTTSEAPIVFHLEEDWELIKKYSIDDMMSVMEANDDLVHLRLSIFPSTDLTCKNWKSFFTWNGSFFECPKQDRGSVGWCGHPSLNQGFWVRNIANALDPTHNPEKQIKWRNKKIADTFEHCRFGAYQSRSSGPAIRDIGRAWMVENGWRKAGNNREYFTVWEQC
jgi:hypothetical protein